jgi:hypothetical protein
MRTTKKTSLNGVVATAGWSGISFRRGEHAPTRRRDNGLEAPKGPGRICHVAQAAADLEAGTEAIVFRICEAIW